MGSSEVKIGRQQFSASISPPRRVRPLLEKKSRHQVAGGTVWLSRNDPTRTLEEPG